MDNQTLETEARKKAQDKIDFLGHLLIYVLVNAMLFGINFLTSKENWWFLFPLLGWGFGLVIHGMSVFVFDSMMEGLKERFYSSELERLKRKGGK